MTETLPLAIVPRHLAIIMDGNGRWARARGLPRHAGHRAGTQNIRPVLEGCVDYGVEVLTVYAFSTENWGRPSAEVHGLMRLLEKSLAEQLDELHAQGVQIRHSGTLEGVSSRLAQKISAAVKRTRNNQRIILNVAFNYGGRQEILSAVRRLIEAGVAPEDVTEELFARNLYTVGLPDPDLIVRTAGEMRLSNFLIWQGAYAEYYSTPTYWPDFDRDELRKALEAYASRERRFGRLKG
jgi:undecaprenyl diphosphate synthase